MKLSFSHIRNIYLPLFVLLLSAGPTFSQSLHYKTDTAGFHTEPRNFDIRTFRTINNYRTSFLNAVLEPADISMLPASIIIPAAMFLWGRAFDNTYHENTGILLGTSEILNVGLTYGIKFLVRRDRPYKTLSNVHHKDVSISDPYSFPSGHSSTTFAISTMFALRYPKLPQVYVPFYLWSILVGYGRVYFGMHYPSDVLAGAVVGALSSITVYSLRNHILNFENQVLGGRNRPDKNYLTAETMGIAAGAFFLSITANELLRLKTDKINIQLSPYELGTNSWKLGINLSF